LVGFNAMSGFDPDLSTSRAAIRFASIVLLKRRLGDDGP
jgi:hypothetical protein